MTCTSCHDQHSQNIYTGKMGGVKGYYKTMFFLRGYYNPAPAATTRRSSAVSAMAASRTKCTDQLNVPTT